MSEKSFRHVLLVESSPHVAPNILLHLLAFSSSRLLSVMYANNPVAAKQLILMGIGEESTFDAIIVGNDFSPMPSGVELIQFIKGHEKFKNVPVLFITASQLPDTERKARNAGADHVINSQRNPRRVIQWVDITTRKR